MKQTIYIELDAIFDTRMGTLGLMDPSLISKSATVEYQERETDNWKVLGWGVDVEAYRARYRARDGDVLQSSVMTNIIYLINGLLDDTISTVLNSPDLEQVDLVVNMYPYHMSDTVRDEILKTLGFILPKGINIKSCFRRPIELLPDWIDSRYDLLIMYNFEEWLKIHGKALEQKRLPHISFYAPAIYKDEPASEELLKEPQEEYGHDAFGFTEISLSPYLMLKMIDAKYFSVVDMHLTKHLASKKIDQDEIKREPT